MADDVKAPTQADDKADATRWDLTPLYSSLTGEDFRQGYATLEKNTVSLEKFFDQHHVRRLPQAPHADETLAALAAECLRLVNDLLMLSDRLEGFVSAIVATDSYNDAAQRELSKLERLETRRRQLGVRLNGWIGSMGEQLPRLIAMRPELKAHTFFLTDTAKQSRWLMREDLEALAAELTLDAGGAFGKLQGNVTSQLKVPFERDGKTETLPITVIRNLSFDPDRAVRERAYKTEIAGWESIRTTVAACMNGVKGTAQTLAKRRGRASVLDVSLDQNKIDRPTLDALLGSIREAFPMFRRYLRSKARKLGLEQLAWWDLFAPLSHSDRRFSWDEARDFIVAKFGGFTADLGGLATRAFGQRWIDGLPRDGKRGGAFCMGVMAIEQSRVLANFDGSFEQVSTLAHELGHAFHNDCQRGLEALQRGAPMTLAETASIFCETLIAEAALEGASHDDRLTILEAQLSGATQVCLDISSRFLFESTVFDERQTGDLSADELCRLMTKAQAETYGDAVDPATYHPYMWLWKPHYYSYDLNYYNFPYAFGHLFALGLWAEYRRQGPSFVAKYKDLLRSTGQDYAAPLVARFGIDITKPDFWRRSLGIIDEQVRRYEAL
jgi:pepF/M3 family oligoendopeptidase